MSRVPLYIEPFPSGNDVTEYRVLSEEFGTEWKPDHHIGNLRYDPGSRTRRFIPEQMWRESGHYPSEPWVGTKEEIVAVRESPDAASIYSRRLFFWMRAVVEAHENG